MESRSRPILLIAVLVLLGLAVWGALGSGLFAAPDLDPVKRAESPARRAAPVAGSAARVPGDPVREVASPGTDESMVPGLTVKVLDPAGAPLPDAEVAFQVVGKSDAFVPEPEREQRAWARRVLLTDARGEARIDAPTDGMWAVYGRKGDLWGAVYVPARAAGQTQELRLQRDRTLRVQVVDAGDRPVSGVCVTVKGAADIDRRGGGGWQESTAAPDGIATFRHVQNRFSKAWGGKAVAILDFPLPEPVFTPWQLDAVPDRIVLRIPGTGSLRVTLVDESGLRFEPSSGAVYAYLHQSDASRDREHWVGLPGGMLDMPHVGLGLHFRMVIDTEECRGAMEFEGPRIPAETVALELRVTVHPVLAGRLLDAGGVPQRGHWYATHVQPGPGWCNQDFETGDDGRFAVSFPDLAGNEGRPRGIVFRRTVPDLEQRAFVDVQRLALHEGRNDLGDIVLRPAPILVAGRVVDEAGAAVEGAELMVFQGDPNGESWAVATLDEGDIHSGAGGAFQVRGHAIGGDLLLRGTLGDARGQLLPFVPGPTPVTYVIPRAGALEMKVATVANLETSDLVFVLRERATGSIEGRSSRHVLEGGVLRWGGLRPGRWDLEVRALAIEEPLARLPDLEVKGGEVHHLPDLVLGADLHRIRLTFADRSGRPVPRATVIVEPRTTDDLPRAALTTTIGSVALHAPRLPLDLLVFAPGYRTASVARVDRDRTVVLEAGIPVAVRARWPDGALREGARLVPLLREHDRGSPPADPRASGHRMYLDGSGAPYHAKRQARLWQQEHALDASGRAQLSVPAPGNYALEWRMELPGDSRDLDVAPHAFTVREGGDPVVLDVELLADALRR